MKKEFNRRCVSTNVKANVERRHDVVEHTQGTAQDGQSSEIEAPRRRRRLSRGLAGCALVLSGGHGDVVIGVSARPSQVIDAYSPLC